MKKVILTFGVLFCLNSFATNGSIVLKYSEEVKSELIQYEYFKSSDFTGNEVVLNLKTNVDVTRLKDEDYPARVCYRGTPAEAKKVLLRIIANTDGNGDYYLDASSVSVVNGKLKAQYTLTGEGGNESHSLTVSACK